MVNYFITKEPRLNNGENQPLQYILLKQPEGLGCGEEGFCIKIHDKEKQV